MKNTNGTAAKDESDPTNSEYFSPLILYGKDVSKTDRFEHEKNIENAQHMAQAWTSFLETICHTAYHKTFPFLKDVESYLRRGGDAREVIEYDQRDTKEREEKILVFYGKMQYLTQVTRQSPAVLRTQHHRKSAPSKKQWQKITKTVLSLPLDHSLWMDLAGYLTEDERVEPTDYAGIDLALTRFTRLRNHLVQGNLRLVFPIARKYQMKGLGYLDLIQEGNIGLMKGVEKFDYTRGYHLSTYATYWICHEIQRALSNLGREIRTPAHTIEKMSKLQKAERKLERQLKRKATPAELAAETEFTEEKVEELLALFSRQTISMQTPRYHTEDPGSDTIEDTLESGQAPSPLETMMEQSLAEEVQQSLEKLTPQERKILTWHYGLGDDNDLTLAKIGRKYKRTRERIRQIQVKALGKLNRSSRLRALVKG